MTYSQWHITRNRYRMNAFFSEALVLAQPSILIVSTAVVGRLHRLIIFLSSVRTPHVAPVRLALEKWA
jgi:hypothetical protein